MRVLVVAASRHGATAEIAEAIAAGLERRGLQAEMRPVETAATLDGWDAIVLGSAVYYGKWLGPAREFVDAHREELAARPVWLFSSGPVGPGEQPAPKENAVNVAALVVAVRPVEHRLLHGRIDRKLLGFAERAVVRGLHVPMGDFRDWPAVDAFAGDIAAHLAATTVVINVT
jgi:menaquinone-dependent protoporphyrinogen oxidase